MNEERKNTGRTIYDEKQVCGRCSNTIIGVVSRVRETDGKPLCRDCIFELDQHARKSGGRVIVEETTAPLTREEKIRRTILWSALAVIILILVWRFTAIAPILQPDKPLRNGTYQTDELTDRCIEQLWVLSKQLQEKRLPDGFPSCPRSDRPYVLVQEEDDIVILCPTPGEHGLTRLSVSYKFPVPLAVPSGE
jgi:hypothetical protein